VLWVTAAAHWKLCAAIIVLFNYVVIINNTCEHCIPPTAPTKRNWVTVRCPVLLCLCLCLSLFRWCCSMAPSDRRCSAAFGAQGRRTRSPSRSSEGQGSSALDERPLNGVQRVCVSMSCLVWWENLHVWCAGRAVAWCEGVFCYFWKSET
jgi:hypothetical protein